MSSVITKCPPRGWQNHPWLKTTAPQQPDHISPWLNPSMALHCLQNESSWWDPSDSTSCIPPGWRSCRALTHTLPSGYLELFDTCSTCHGPWCLLTFANAICSSQCAQMPAHPTRLRPRVTSLGKPSSHGSGRPGGSLVWPHLIHALHLNMTVHVFESPSDKFTSVYGPLAGPDL